MTHIPARLMVFAKAPVPGRVMTRLIPCLGAEGAAELQTQLLARTLEMASESSLGRVELWIAGDPSHAVIREQAGRYGIPIYTQQGSDLGERMAHALAMSNSGVKRLIIGTDCPAMDAEVLVQALASLEEADVVFQPAEDGGYTLIGMVHDWPQLFENIDWGGPEVLAQSLERARRLQLRVALLPMSWDLDRQEDYHRAIAETGITPVEVQEE